MVGQAFRQNSRTGHLLQNCPPFVVSILYMTGHIIKMFDDMFPVHERSLFHWFERTSDISSSSSYFQIRKSFQHERELNRLTRLIFIKKQTINRKQRNALSMEFITNANNKFKVDAHRVHNRAQYASLLRLLTPLVQEHTMY